MQLPILDDRTYADFVNEARALIPTLAPGWTDHNPSDPGIVLVELFAWLAEIVLYRLDRVPETSYRTFLDLLRGPPADPDHDPLAGLALDDAIRTIVAQLRDRHRAITPDDFEFLALRSWPTRDEAVALGVLGIVRRALCIAEQSPLTLPDRWKPAAANAPGHFTIVVVPESLAADRSDLPAFDPARRYAFELDGTAAYVDCGTSTTLSLTQKLTLSAWIFPRSVTGTRGIVCRAATTGEYELLLAPGGVLKFTQGDGTDACSSAPGAVPLGRWSHVAAVRAADGVSVTLFVNGQPVGSRTLTKNPVATASNPVWIGRMPGTAPNSFFDGFIRDVAIWSLERSATDLGGDLRRALDLAPDGTDPRGSSKPVASWRLDVAPQPGAKVPDCETPPATAPGARLRDGTLHGGSFRDVVRPLAAAPALLQGLTNLFDESRLLTTQAHVVAYKPLRVAIAATLYLRADADVTAVRAAVPAALDRFLDPLAGWRGTGWPFGRAVYNLDLADVLDGIAGVDFVTGIQVALVDPAQIAAVAAGQRPPPPHDEHGAPIGVALQPDELPSFDSATIATFQRAGTQWQPR